MPNPQPSGRVVVTGAGALTPLGTGIETFWPRLVKGESGIGAITLFDVAEYPTRIAGQVKDFDPEQWLDKKEARRIDRFLAFAAAAAQMAIDDACFPSDERLRMDTGVLIGSGIGGLTTMGEQTRRLHEGGPSKVSPFLVPYMIPDMASGYVSILHGLKAPTRASSQRAPPAPTRSAPPTTSSSAATPRRWSAAAPKPPSTRSACPVSARRARCPRTTSTLNKRAARSTPTVTGS